MMTLRRWFWMLILRIGKWWGRTMMLGWLRCLIGLHRWYYYTEDNYRERSTDIWRVCQRCDRIQRMNRVWWV